MSPDPRTSGAEPAPGGSVVPDEESAAPVVKHRPAWLVFVVLGAIVCLGMGVWQLARYQQITGTAQNLGYTFMWPFLAWFLFYAYYKYIRLEAEEAADVTASGVGARTDGPGADGSGFDDDDTAADPRPTTSPPRGRAHPAEPRTDPATPGTHPAESGGQAAQPRAHSASSRRAHLATTRGRSRSRGRSSTATEIPSDILPTRRPVADEQIRDEGLDTYNTYLAELARQDGEITARARPHDVATPARPHDVAADQPQENRQK